MCSWWVTRSCLVTKCSFRSTIPRFRCNALMCVNWSRTIRRVLAGHPAPRRSRNGSIDQLNPVRTDGPQEGSDSQLNASNLIDGLLTIANHLAKNTNRRWGQSDLRNVAHLNQVGRQPRVALVTLIRILLQAMSVSRVGQLRDPFHLLDQQIHQSHRTRTNFDCRLNGFAQAADVIRDPLAIVCEPLFSRSPAIPDHAVRLHHLVVVAPPHENYRIVNARCSCLAWASSTKRCSSD